MDLVSAKTRLAIHAEAAADLARAKTAYETERDYVEGLSIGEHPDALQAAEDEVDRLEAVYVAAKSAERLARIAYTDPLGRGREADTVPVYWPGNGSLDPALTLG